jgi:hypothetical protein
MFCATRQRVHTRTPMPRTHSPPYPAVPPRKSGAQEDGSGACRCAAVRVHPCRRRVEDSANTTSGGSSDPVTWRALAGRGSGATVLSSMVWSRGTARSPAIEEGAGSAHEHDGAQGPSQEVQGQQPAT